MQKKPAQALQRLSCRGRGRRRVERSLDPAVCGLSPPTPIHRTWPHFMSSPRPSYYCEINSSFYFIFFSQMCVIFLFFEFFINNSFRVDFCLVRKELIEFRARRY